MRQFSQKFIHQLLFWIVFVFVVGMTAGILLLKLVKWWAVEAE